MAYPNFYTNPYPQAYYAPPMPDNLAQLRQGQYQQIPQTTFQQDMRDDRIWVSGENAANSYLLVPNAFVRLWDSTDCVFYEKQADSNGKPLPMRVFDYSERTATPKQPAQAAQPLEEDYVTRKEFDALAARLDALSAQKIKKQVTVKEDAQNG